MKKVRMQKGITLIALIITIVVLMILAAVAISSIQNDNILSYANNAAKTYNQAQKNEQDILDGYLSHMPGNNNDGSTGNALFDSITSSNYGDSITFSTDLNSDGDTTNDWKVFYKDSNYLYIISAGYLPNSYVPSSLTSGEDYIETNGTYGVKFSVNSSKYDDEGNTVYEPAQIENSVAQKYMFSWWLQEEYNGSTNTNARAIALLLNTDAWTGTLVNSELASAGVEAIGTPTLDMWVASWNATSSDIATLYYSYANAGYYVGTSENPTTEGVGAIHADDTLYAPYEDGVDGFYDHWLAGPGGYGMDGDYGPESMYVIDPYGAPSSGDAFYGSYRGLRPIISIPASLVSGTIDALTVSK